MSGREIKARTLEINTWVAVVFGVTLAFCGLGSLYLSTSESSYDLARDERFAYNMEVNKQDAIAEIAPHLDRLVASLTEVCAELGSNSDSDLLEQCRVDLAKLSSDTDAIKSGNFD